MNISSKYKKRLLIILLTFVLTPALSQNELEYGYYKYPSLDTIVVFKEGVNEYPFLLSKRQGFYWDTISHQMDCHDVIFSILNDSKDTLYLDRIKTGDGALLYHRANFNDEYDTNDPLRYAVFPNHFLKISVELYSIEYRKNFNRPLLIKYYRNNRSSKENHFSLDSWGHFIEGYSISDEDKYEYRVRTFKKTSNRYAPKRIDKIPYKLEIGEFQNNKLINGKIDFYSSKDSLLISKEVKEGKIQEGFIYKEKKVNQLDESGKKSGIWVAPIRANAYEEFRKIPDADSLFEGIRTLDKYWKGNYVDTCYRYRKDGSLGSLYIGAKDTIPPKVVIYHENGLISQINHYKYGVKHKHELSYSDYYSDSIPNCIIKKEVYVGVDKDKLKYTYTYKNCKVYSKSSPKEKMIMSESGTVKHYESTPEVEGGNSESYFVEEAVDPIPIPVKVPYTLEKGTFDETETFLVDGHIYYYDKYGVLIDTKEVVDGLIIE